MNPLNQSEIVTAIRPVLDWYRLTGETSERQWGDVLGVLKVQDALLDQAYLEHWASVLRLSPLLHQALSDAGL